ncbi:MAG: hypothetical protein JXA90_13525 [Planctomycetes bacterium]|nr:hypothetical protein [Planctomycetota bacterium]
MTTHDQGISDTSLRDILDRLEDIGVDLQVAYERATEEIAHLRHLRPALAQQAEDGWLSSLRHAVSGRVGRYTALADTLEALEEAEAE